MNYISAREASEIMKITVQATYQAIRWGSLKHVKQDGKILTTREWIDEYQLNKHSKQLHAQYNGKPTFNPDQGDLSILHVCQLTGLTEGKIHYEIKQGRIKAFRRGVYWVIREEELANIQKIADLQHKTA